MDNLRISQVQFKNNLVNTKSISETFQEQFRYISGTVQNQSKKIPILFSDLVKDTSKIIQIHTF